MTKQATPEQNEAYRRGACIDCQTAPHSAGRPRCDSCHDKHDDERTANRGA